MGIKVYGIKNCGSVKSALSYLKAEGKAYEFVDFAKEPPLRAQVESWLKHVGMGVLLNTKGTKYRSLGLSGMQLDESQKLEWLIREPLLIKRPVVELEDGGVLVGFDAAVYAERLK